MRRLLLPLCGLLVLACGEDESGEESEAPGEDCVDNAAFFQKEVWKGVLAPACFSCHSAQGAAKDSALVYQQGDQVGASAFNLAQFGEMAAFEKDGTSVVLLKPTAEISHGGGKLMEVGDEAYETLEAMIERIANPVSCGESGPVNAGFDGVSLFDPHSTLRRAAIALAGRVPTPEEIEAVEEGGLAAVEASLDRMLREEAFYVRMAEIFNDLLLTDKYIGGSRAVNLLDQEQYPNIKWYDLDDALERAGDDPSLLSAARQHTNRSVAREPIDLMLWILRNELPFTELVTADYMVVNPFSALAYGLELEWADPYDPKEFQAAQHQGVPHAGLLSSPMFLNRYPTTDTNRNRHRSRIVYRYFLATDILKLAERPIDPTSTVHNPTLNDPQCKVCHAALDPVAGAFQNWNPQGSYLPPESWFEDMLPPGFGETDLPFDTRPEALNWLGAQIAEDERFDIAMVSLMFEALVGHRLLREPAEDDAQYDARLSAFEKQQAWVDKVGKEFRANGHDLRWVIKSIIRSAWFRARNAESAEMDEARRAELEDLGVGRLLTPEQLTRKLTAVTGFPWRPRVDQPDFLLDGNQYRLLYGGIDSDDVVERIGDPNGIIANIQLRMANDVACRVVARDFGKASALNPRAGSDEAEERLLFPHVERGFVPEDHNGFAVDEAQTAIRTNIRHLHARVLGETIAPWSEEENATYALFYETWREGMDGIIAEEIGRTLSGLCRAVGDYYTGEEWPDEQRITDDSRYTVRAWMAVMTYLLADYRFLYE